MKIEKILRTGLVVEVALMMGIVTLLYLMTSTQASYFRIYELFGALFAIILTTFGIYKMRKLT